LAAVLFETCGASWYSALVLSHGQVREVAKFRIGAASARDESGVAHETWAAVCLQPAEVMANCVSNSARRIPSHACAPCMPVQHTSSDARLQFVYALRSGVPYGLVLVAPECEEAHLELGSGIGEWADIVLTALAKHAMILDRDPTLVGALGSAAEIESCLRATSDLTHREAEVCARVLFGMSSIGIALDLCVRECTVKTYRRRAYQRLSLGSERELLTWYLARWGAWRQQQVIGAPFTLRDSRALAI